MINSYNYKQLQYTTKQTPIPQTTVHGREAIYYYKTTVCLHPVNIDTQHIKIPNTVNLI